MKCLNGRKIELLCDKKYEYYIVVYQLDFLLF